MNTMSFWKSFLWSYLAITVVVFIFFDLIPAFDGNQAFGLLDLVIRIPVAIGLTYFLRWLRWMYP